MSGDAQATKASTPEDEAAGSTVDRKLLEFLVCPMTGAPLVYDRERQELISRTAGRAFPIHNGIPIMLIDEARILED